MDWRFIVLEDGKNMKILCKRGEKDYYDYLVSEMGMDEKVVYDRRSSTVIGPYEYYNFDYPCEYDVFFSKKPFKCDEPKVKKALWDSHKHDFKNNRFNIGWKRGRKEEIEEGDIYYLFLEVGYHQFIFEVERYLDEDGKVKIVPSIVSTKTVSKDDKKGKTPLYIGILYESHLTSSRITHGHDNPILANTWIPKLILAKDMWNMLYEYISSLNDKEFVDTRTNEQHIESHGFDKKISFRHRR